MIKAKSGLQAHLCQVIGARPIQPIDCVVDQSTHYIVNAVVYSGQEQGNYFKQYEIMQPDMREIEER
jgi:hypothetical protein